jgi:GxxExxY protein
MYTSSVVTTNKLLTIAKNIMVHMGGGRSERVYQNCLLADLAKIGLVTRSETTVPIYYEGQVVGWGRSDITVDNCCIELKSVAKSPQCASKQVRDYVDEMNKRILLKYGIESMAKLTTSECSSESPFFRKYLRPLDGSGDVAKTRKEIADSLFWGVVINFNSCTGEVQLFVPGLEETLKQLGKDILHSSNSMLQSSVEKYFGLHGYHQGVVKSVSYDNSGKPWFRVRYVDGDTEDMRMPALYDILTCIGKKSVPGGHSIALKRMKRDVENFLNDHIERDFSEMGELSYSAILKHFELNYRQLVGCKGNWFKKELLRLLPHKRVCRDGEGVTVFYGTKLL